VSYEVAHIDELEELPINNGEFVWRPVRRRFGITAFGTNAYTGNAGQRVIEEHAEADNHQEMYVVLRGRATFTLDDTEVDAPAGTLLVVDDPGVYRRAVAAEAGTAILALGGPPVFVPSDSEWIERARPYLRSDPERAIRILDDLRAAKPDGPVAEVAATFLALARGDGPAAHATLARLLARRPDLRPVLADDADLEPLLDT